MKTLNLKSIALFASILVLSAGFTSCQDEPDMPRNNVPVDMRPSYDKTAPDHGAEATSCTFYWSIDPGVQSVIVNDKIYEESGSISVKVGDIVTYDAIPKANRQINENRWGAVQIQEKHAGGVVGISITTHTF